MSDLGPPFCSTCGGNRGKREPADSDGLGCLENIYHSEDDQPAPYTQAEGESH